MMCGRTSRAVLVGVFAVFAACALADEDPALPGTANYETQLVGLQSSEGHLNPQFTQEGGDFKIFVDNGDIKMLVLTLVLHLAKYDMLHCPIITINDEPFEYSPIQPLIFKVKLNESIAPFDKMFRIKIADPSGPSGAWPFARLNAHEYNLHVLQPPDFDHIVEAQSLMVTSSAGQELISAETFDPQQEVYTYHVAGEVESVVLAPRCGVFATGMKINGESVNINDTEVVELVHSRTTVDFQCQYSDATWTSVIQDKTYSVRFLHHTDVSDLTVALRISQEQGYCAMRQMDREVDGKSVMQNGWICRTNVDRPLFIATYDNIHVDIAVQNDKTKVSYRLPMGVPAALGITHERSQWTMKAFGGSSPITFPVEVIFAAACETLRCSPGLVQRPTLHNTQAAQARLCFEEECSRNDEAHCCTQAAKCSTFSSCPAGKALILHSSDVVCNGAYCTEADAEVCCGAPAMCSAFGGCSADGKVLKKDAKQIACSGAECTAEDVDVCCMVAPVNPNTSTEAAARAAAERAAAHLAFLRRQAAKLRRALVSKRIDHYQFVGCSPHPNANCSGQTCYFDESCLQSPPRLGGIGCWAAGLDQSCRFCGFGLYPDCPHAPKCFEGDCHTWTSDHLNYCQKYYDLQCLGHVALSNEVMFRKYDASLAPGAAGSGAIGIFPRLPLVAVGAACALAVAGIAAATFAVRSGRHSSVQHRDFLVALAAEDPNTRGADDIE